MKNNHIFLGSVVHPISLYYKNDEYSPAFLNQSGNNFALVSYQLYRRILFQMSDQNQLVDLLYDTPPYPILGIHFVSNGSSILISNPVMLADSITAHDFLVEQKQMMLQYKELFVPHQKEGKIRLRKNDYFL